VIDSQKDSETGKSHWAVLADDLTGAMDVAASFANRGFDVDVVLNRRVHPFETEGIVVLSTDSRSAKSTSARRLVNKSLEQLEAWGFSLLFKKIDSTCKGNLVAEMDAIASMLGRQCLLCPTNLPQGRTLRKGWLIVHGRRLLNVQDLLEQQGASLVRMIANRNAADLEKSMSAQPEDYLVVDAERPAQLTRLAQWAYQNRERILLVGSANVASLLARELAKDNGMTQQRRKPSPSTRSAKHSRESPAASASELPVVVLSGSRNPVNDRQITYLKKRSRVVEVAFNQTGAIKAQRALEKKRDVLLSIPTHQRSASVIQERLKFFARSLHPEQVAGLVICGGDTACAVLKSLRPGAVRVFGELIPGLAWGKLLRGPADGLLLCTKPGGFGTADALLAALGSMRGFADSRDGNETRTPNM
jgi:uncharacterized protein YgbK (DUF1537 family)